MDSLPHLLHIGTLATWLSVAGFGTVGIIMPDRHTPLDARPVFPETRVIARDFTLGGELAPAAQEPPTTPDAAPVETSPVPPELPAMPELTALPPLPDVPEVQPSPQPTTEIASAPRRPVSADANARPTRRAAGHPAAAHPDAPGGGHGLSNAARLAAGSMPPPDYPAEARRRGQTGTLLVEFTVDAGGRVIAASALAPSPWPLLNEEAVRAVRRWTFPPGAVMKLQRPIVFQLR